MSDPITIKEAITIIQEEAYASIGMSLYDVQAHYQSERARLAKMMVDNPGYLRTREEMLSRDPSLGFIELDLPKRFDKLIPGLPYQDPYLYPWMEDILKNYHNKLKFSEDMLPSVIVATAPTGNFNAIAIPGNNQSGIVIEDGLMNVAINISNQIAYLLYEKLKDGRYLEKEIDALSERIAAQQERTESLATVIWEYVTEGYSYLPGPVGDTPQEDFSVRHILSSDFVLFVLKHEGFHIDWWKKNQVPTLLQDRKEQMWNYYRDYLMEVLPEQLSAVEFGNIYYAQQEELLADFFAFTAVLELAKKENTVSSSLKGGLLFFFIAELIQDLIFRLTEPEFIDKLYSYEDNILALTAIVTKESHPYAILRKRNLLSMVKQVYPHYTNLLEQENAKLDFISTAVKRLLDQKITNASANASPHPKWSNHH